MDLGIFFPSIIIVIHGIDIMAPVHRRRIAIVHEWFTAMRGGEKCVEAMCELYPDATVFVLLHNEGSVSETIERMNIRTSFVQHLPLRKSYYRNYLPLFPRAIESLDLSSFDLVISSNHCVAKGVKVRPSTLHVCYCYTPMRYIWGLYDQYFSRERAGLLTRLGMRLVRPYLRKWDLRTSQNPQHFIAISRNVQQRIRQTYGRTSDIVYPPVETNRFSLSHTSGEYYLIVSALVPYKRVDLAIEVFNRLQEKLVIVGDGPELGRLKSMAGQNIEFAGFRPDAELVDYYRQCKALIFPGEEDFGIVPVEAMASGKPVIAFSKGGALETVIDSDEIRTGILFNEQSPESLLAAINRFEKTSFIPDKIRDFALRFDKEEFKNKFRTYVESRWQEFLSGSPQTIK